MRAIRSLALTAAIAIVAGACGGEEKDCCAAPAGTPTPGMSTAGALVNISASAVLGDILTDSAGMTLYISTQDTPGQSACTGSCAATWPPLTTSNSRLPVIKGLARSLSLVTRDDGTRQVAFDGRPLYRHSGDRQPGDTTGEGAGGTWFAARASGDQPTGK